jgi:hypothetical protein
VLADEFAVPQSPYTERYAHSGQATLQ